MSGLCVCHKAVLAAVLTNNHHHHNHKYVVGDKPPTLKVNNIAWPAQAPPASRGEYLSLTTALKTFLILL